MNSGFQMRAAQPIVAIVLGLCSVLSGGRILAATCASGASGTIMCYETATYPHIVVQIALDPGTWEFSVSDLKNLPGMTNTVDPMMWLLDQASGTILAIDDDGGPGLAPLITKTITTATLANVLVAGALDTAQGTLDLTVKKNGVVVNAYNDLWFGGWRKSNHRVAAGDRMFVGFPSSGGLQAGVPGDSFFWLSSSSSSCSSSCGTFLMAPWTAGTMSQMTVPTASTSSTILVGAWFQSSYIGTRWFHSRLGAAWGNTQPFTDADCDGLTYELEALPLVAGYPNARIETCDTASGPSADCNSGLQFSTRGQSMSGTPLSGITFKPWNARDTDNDGMRDDWELYGVRMRCSKTPSAPFFNPGTCTDDTYRYTRRDGVICGTTPTTTYTATNALSTHAIHPRDYTVLLEAAIAAPAVISSTVQDLAMYVYSEEGLECQENTSISLTADCPGTIPDYIDLHILPSNAGMTDAEVLTGTPRLWYGFGNFNANFTANRKYTNSFFYSNLLTKSAGEGFRRTFVMKRGATAGDGYVFSHELGHTLDLRHNNARNMRVTVVAILY